MSTTQTTPEHTTDDHLEADLEAFADEVFGAALGALETTVMAIGREKGLYAALRGQDGATAAALADATSLDERYVREWAEHQAVAGVLAVDDPAAGSDSRVFRLPESRAIALLDEDHPAYVGALADLAPVIARTLHLVLDAFDTGDGIPFAAYEVHDMQAGFTRPMFANSLTSEWLPSVPGLQAKFDSGDPVRVADFGCGEGWAGIYIAEAYPNVTVDGFDLDEASIDRARKHAADRGVADRVTFSLADVAKEPIPGPYDLVMSCEVIHDLADPTAVLAAMRRAIADDGDVLIIDERVAEQFETTGDPIERLMYAVSILHCLPAGRAAEESAATGTVMRPDTFRSYARAAGFSSVDELPIENPMFRFYLPEG